MFERVRQARPLSLPLPPLFVAAVGWLAASHLAMARWPAVLETATRGVITPLFLASAAGVGLVLLATLLVGRIGLDDLGLDPDYVGRGIGIVVMIWAAAQVVGVIPRVVANRPVALDPVFEAGSRWELAGKFLDALGTASLEEIAFRGFLLVQLYLLFLRKRGKPHTAIGYAIVVVLLIAGLASLGWRYPYESTRLGVESQAVVLATGLFLTWLFIRTRNIYFVIGIHTLLLAPTPVVAGPSGGGHWYQPLVIGILASVWTLLWPRRN